MDEVWAEIGEVLTRNTLIWNFERFGGFSTPLLLYWFLNFFCSFYHFHSHFIFSLLFPSFSFVFLSFFLSFITIFSFDFPQLFSSFYYFSLFLFTLKKYHLSLLFFYHSSFSTIFFMSRLFSCSLNKHSCTWHQRVPSLSTNSAVSASENVHLINGYQLCYADTN